MSKSLFSCYNDVMKVMAYGKLNLCLYVCGTRGGYHIIDSVMHTVNLGDILDVRESDDICITIYGATVPEETDSTRKAAIAVYEQTGVKFSATVEKHIPVGGGMGGSSADGAGLIYAAEKLLAKRGIVLDTKKAAAATGSDVAFMIKGGAARVRGTGDVISSLPPCTFDALVVDCGEVSTAACYSAFDNMRLPCGGNCERIAEKLLCGKAFLAEDLNNDLFASACALNSRVSEAYGLLHEAGIKAHLTGSGGCLFVVGKDCAAAERALGGKFRSFRVKSKNCGAEVISD